MTRTTSRRLDLNADLGEAETDDERAREQAVLSLVSSASVSCGAHAGDEVSIRLIVRAAATHGVAVGAHPGYPDRRTRGRRPLQLDSAEVSRLIADQLARFHILADECDVRVTHVKPHGALYNQAADDRRLADAVAHAVRSLSPALRLVGLAGSALLDAGRQAGLAVVAEAFADRRYGPDGRLVPRTVPGAVIIDPETAARQAVAIARRGTVTATDGADVPVECDTIGLHGDTDGALEIARRVRLALEREGVEIAPFP